MTIAEIEALLRGTPRVAPDLKHARLEDRLIAVGRTAQGPPALCRVYDPHEARPPEDPSDIGPLQACHGDCKL